MSVSREKEREEEVRRREGGALPSVKSCGNGISATTPANHQLARKGGNKSNRRRAGVTLAPREKLVEIGAAKVGHFEEQPRLTPHPRYPRIIIVTPSTSLLEKRLKYCIKTLTSHETVVLSSSHHTFCSHSKTVDGWKET